MMKMNQSPSVIVFREGDLDHTLSATVKSSDLEDAVVSHGTESVIQTVDSTRLCDSPTPVHSSVDEESTQSSAPVYVQRSTSSPVSVQPLRTTVSIPSSHPSTTQSSHPSSTQPPSKSGKSPSPASQTKSHPSSALFETDPVPVVPKIPPYFSKRRPARPVSFSSEKIRSRCDPSLNSSCPDITMVTQLT